MSLNISDSRRHHEIAQLRKNMSCLSKKEVHRRLKTVLLYGNHVHTFTHFIYYTLALM